MHNGEKGFLGWRVLLGCFIVMLVIQGGISTFSIYMPAIAQDTGWAVSTVAMVATFATGGAFLANLCVSRLVNRMGPRWVIAIGALLLAAHYLLFSFCKTPYLLWLTALLGGGAIGFGTVASCSIIITNWFVKNRSQYVAIIVAGGMFGSTLLNPAAGLLIHRYGWRCAYCVQAAILGTIAMACALLLIRDSPEKVGQLPYGGACPQDAPNAAEPPADGAPAANPKSSLSFWLLLFGMFFLAMSTNIDTYLPAYWQLRGMSPVTSSTIMGIYAFAIALGSIGMSKVSDRLGGKAYISIATLIYAGCMLIMMYSNAVYSFAALAVLCLFLALGAKKATGVALPIVVTAVFGRKEYARIVGPIAAMTQLGIAASNPIIGMALNSGGADPYARAFLLMLGVSLVGLLLVLWAMAKRLHTAAWQKTLPPYPARGCGGKPLKTSLPHAHSETGGNNHVG